MIQNSKVLSRLFVGAIASSVFLISACGGKANVRKPTELVKIAEPKVEIVPVWKRSVAPGSKKLRAGLELVAEKDALFTANVKGEVFALSLDTGEVQWQSKTGAPVSAGPAVVGDLVVVATLDGEVIALSRSKGVERWRAQVSSEVIGAPAGDGDVVLVRAGDGRIYGLSTLDGSRKWTFDRPVPALTLRGVSAPVVVGGVAVLGMDNGRVLAVRLSDGTVFWEQAIASSTGRTELERIVDIDAALMPTFDALFVMSYGGEVALLDPSNGEANWRRSIKSYSGASLADDKIISTDSDGVVWALAANSGAAAWQQEALKYRVLSQPATISDYVMVSDLDGYLHVLDSSTGDIVGRKKLLKTQVSASPASSVGGFSSTLKDTVFWMDASGYIVAVKLQQKQ